MRAISCRKCGAKVSDQYSFCPNCLTIIGTTNTESFVVEERESSELLPKDKMRRAKGWKRWLGEPNILETYFMYAFLLSIFVGILFGFVNQTMYYLANAYMHRSSSAFEIFIHNFQVDVLTIFTGGLLILISNFLTFGAISGAIVVRHPTFVNTILVLVIVFGSYGIVEMSGHLCFGLIGFTFLERILLKKRTRLNRTSLIMLGTALMLVAASIEWWDILKIP